MLLPEPFEPNYEAITSSAIWRDQIRPMLEAMYVAALEGSAAIGAMPRLPDGTSPTLEDFHFWRGWCAAVKEIASLPDRVVTQERVQAAEEKKDAFVGEQESRRRDARRANA